MESATELVALSSSRGEGQINIMFNGAHSRGQLIQREDVINGRV